MIRTAALAALGAVLLTSAPALSAAPAPAAAPDTGPVAKVNGVGIPRDTFDRTWRYFLQRSGIPTDHADKTGKVEELRSQVLDRLVDEELLFQEAAKRDLLAPAEAVDAELEKARAQFESPEQFAAALEQNSLDEAGLRAILNRNLSIQRLVAEEIAPALTVTDEEVGEFYSANRKEFQLPEQVRARHILLKVDEKADDAQRGQRRDQAAALLAQLKEGADFAALAREKSECPSSAQGGDLGFFARGQMVPPFEEAAFALKPGELSGVVETQFGYHVIKLEERQEAAFTSEAEAAPEIRDFLKARKTEEGVVARIKVLRERAAIELLLEL